MDKEYPFHKGARTALNISGVLLCIVIITIPIAIWIFIRTAGARVFLTPSGLKAKGLVGTTSFDYSEVDRLGLLKVAVVKNAGLAGALAKEGVGGDEATHIIVKTKAGKDRSFMVSRYENSQEIIDEVGKRIGKPYEIVGPGAVGGVYSPKWP